MRFLAAIATGITLAFMGRPAGAVPADAPAQGALTAQEQRWIEAVWPVFAQARQAGLPVDIVVQPQRTAGAAPLALAYLGQRCKLVFSMRENPAVQAQEQRIAQQLGPGAAPLAAALELMAAHELFGHCARHVGGRWREVPAGYAESMPGGLDAALQAEFRVQRAQRREEGWADLAALAWARAERRADYPRLQAWLLWERGQDLVEGGSHDTRAWLQRAQASLRSAAEVWREVLLDETDGAQADGRTTTAQGSGP